MNPEVAGVLRVGGKFPRRVVLLPDGGLGDRAQHPELPEVELLSRLCELARTAAGQPVWPRRTAELLDAALASNAPGAWEALRDDLLTGDLDLEAAAAVLRHSSNAATLVTCLVGSRDAAHMLHVAAVLSRVLDALSEESRVDVGRQLACQLRQVMDVFARHGALMSRDVRDAVLHGFGRTLALVGVSDAHVAELVLHALAQRRDELLRLFLHVPTAFVAHKPQVLAELLDRARAAPPHERYPAVALLARVVAADPALVAGCERDVLDLAAAVVTVEPLDSRMCVAAATLAMAALGDDATTPQACLARALRACAVELVRRAS